MTEIDPKELERLVNGIHEASTAPMRQICIEKVLNLIDDKLSGHYRIISLETKNLILGLREEIKGDIKLAIKDALDNNKEKVSWGIELIKLCLTIGAVFGLFKVFG